MYVHSKSDVTLGTFDLIVHVPVTLGQIFSIKYDQRMKTIIVKYNRARRLENNY